MLRQAGRAAAPTFMPSLSSQPGSSQQYRQPGLSVCNHFSDFGDILLILSDLCVYAKRFTLTPQTPIPVTGWLTAGLAVPGAAAAVHRKGARALVVTFTVVRVEIHLQTVENYRAMKALLKGPWPETFIQLPVFPRACRTFHVILQASTLFQRVQLFFPMTRTTINQT